MKKTLILILIFITTHAYAQTGLLMQRYYISGSLSVGLGNRIFADTSAWLQLGTDTTGKGVLLPRVVLDSIATSKRGLFVYDLKDSVLYHFDKSKRVRYMTYKDTTLVKQLIAANPPDLSPYFKDGGNALNKTAVLGTTDNKGIIMVIDDTAAVSISNKRVWTKNGRTNITPDIPLSIGTGYEMYNLAHGTGGEHTYISGVNGDYASGYALVFGKPANKILQLTDAQVQLNQNTVIGTGKTLQLGNVSSFENTPNTGFRYSAASGWNFAIKDMANNNKLAIMSTGNVLINSSTDDNYKLSVSGTTRITDEVYIEKALTFKNTTQGIQLLDASPGAFFPSIFIGKDNGVYPTTGSRHIKIGTGNSSNPSKSFTYILGTVNNLLASGHYNTCIGTFNNIQSEEPSQLIIGDNNVINYPITTTSRGQCVIGSTNSVLHMYSSIIGNYQQTTGNNQLIIADANPNATSGGYRQIYFGSGPRSMLQTGIGAPVTINSSGGNGTDKAGGLLRLAAGKSTGNAVAPDMIFATATTTVSGVDLQALTDRWYVKGETGRMSNNILPTALLDVGASTGYNQLRLRTAYTPSSTADVNGNTGDISWDENYIYIKTSSGWKRTALSSF